MNPKPFSLIFHRARLIGGLLAAMAAYSLELDLSFAADTDANRIERWEFGTEEETLFKSHGAVQRDQTGPRPPEFPDFPADNTAIRLNGKGSYLAIADTGSDSSFDFSNGDAITLEAWIKLDTARAGSPMYIVGKGRTGSPKFSRDNQNWSLRVVTTDEVTQLSFLFATKPGPGIAHWHRWTSNAGFEALNGWHHIAISYRFGEPDSIRGWIDGKPTDGTWGLGGKTKAPPVVDDDAVWIGSSLAGSAGNSFIGWLDSVAIHRSIADDQIMTAKFRRVGGARVVEPVKEVMPVIDDLPKGRVLVTIGEAFPSHERWLKEGENFTAETTRWQGDSFLLPRIPLRYDAWGIRADWKAPLMVRMAADVEFTPGKQRLLLRARGLSRLWVDGEVVARTEAITKQPPNGEEPVTPVAKAPFPGLRIAGYHQQEVTGEATIPAGDGQASRTCRVVLEMVVGGKNLRAETGEICVAVLGDDGKSYLTLRPAGLAELPLTDAAIEPELRRIEASLAGLDDQLRHAASATQDEFWARRHAAAAAWTKAHPAPAVPKVKDPAVKHPVDAFIAARIEGALEAAAGSDPIQAQKFHHDVLPVLSENCFRCHGEKSKGGLKLNSREAALLEGDSELPAVVPGKVEASELIARIESDDEDLRMPPTGDPLDAKQITALENWIREGAAWPAPPIDPGQVANAPLIDDQTFLRRVYLDTVGVPPDFDAASAFLADNRADKRDRLIDRLLADPRSADHRISHWLDELAENPTLLNASLNSSGPFRFFLHDALRDNKPLDRMVTELILMRGSVHGGGSAGFSLAAENDAPFAAKGHIVASTFLGVELQCARCHDSPFHSTTQRDLFSLAAMLQRKPATVPETSRVPDAFFENQTRESLIRVTLKPDETIQPAWPFAKITGLADGPEIDQLMYEQGDSRERLAALITAPQNQRFPRVIVNRLWKRLLGAGFVEPAHDWEGHNASHPDLLAWLASELVAHNYDLNHVTRLILTSQTYQREAIGNNLAASDNLRFFNAPDRRRLTAEQIVDSMHDVVGSPMDIGELTFVHDGRRPLSNRLTLGRPTRSWMLASLNNERDRPSLSLPQARAETDILQAFGWNGSRQMPITRRDRDPNLLQPGVLANGTLTSHLTRATDQSLAAQVAIDAKSPAALVDEWFLRILCRYPDQEERATFATALTAGFDSRVLPADQIQPIAVPEALPLITWFNHQRPEATTVQKQVEQRVRQGPPADPRLRSAWREIYEDFIWSLINHRDFVWLP